MELYHKLLTVGKKHIDPLQEPHELQNLCDFVYIVESTPQPHEPTYSPMFLYCIIHRSLWKKISKKIEAHHLSYHVMDYNRIIKYSNHLPDTQKRRLLFEMLDRWWFFEEAIPHSLPLRQAFQFREYFFRQEFAYLPQKFRGMVERMDFNTAVNSLTREEDQFLDDIIRRTSQSYYCCGCIPIKKNDYFSQRFHEPAWYDLPSLGIRNTDNINVADVEKAIHSGEFLYMMVFNYHDCLDRGLYKTLHTILQSVSK